MDKINENRPKTIFDELTKLPITLRKENFKFRRVISIVR